MRMRLMGLVVAVLVLAAGFVHSQAPAKPQPTAAARAKGVAAPVFDGNVANIVGFALTNQKAQTDLAGFAQGTGGSLYSAQSGQALADALLVAATSKFSYVVFDAAGKQVAAGEIGYPPEQLPPGDYKVVVKAGAREVVAPRVKIALGQEVTLRLVMKNGQLVLE